MSGNGKRKLRSQEWWSDYTDPDMTALYLERYLNFGLTREELQTGRPIIGIAQTGSDLAPCNRHHLQLAERVRRAGVDEDAVELAQRVVAGGAVDVQTWVQGLVRGEDFLHDQPGVLADELAQPGEVAERVG